MQNILTEEQKKINREQAAYKIIQQFITALIEGGSSNDVQSENT